MMHDTPLRPLGRIVRLQVQRSSLTVGENPRRYYDPAALQAVDALTLTTDGALLRLPDGGVQLDLHHTGHPLTHNREGENDLSLGFTSHYAAMRQRFGPHLADGCAGENILIETEQPVGLPMLAGGVAIRPAGGQLIWLHKAAAAPPCRPFSGYAAGSDEARTIKSALQFLDNGMRGFYCVYEDQAEAAVAVGDKVYVLAA